MSNYALPTVEDLFAVEPNGFRVASTFAGGGGSSTGYRLAGFDVGYASEFVPEARETYRANARPSTYLDDRDIREVEPSEILDILGLGVGELDILDGSPPCSPFSTSGKREAGWGREVSYSGRKQRTDDLFYEFIRLVDGIRPKVFVAENVSGLVRGSAIGYFKRILVAMKEIGYVVSARVLDASWLGVPQARKRLIFVGVREDLGLAPVHPAPFERQISLAEALALAEEFDGVSSDLTHDPETGVDLTLARYSIGEMALTLRPGETHKERFNLVRPDPRRPAPTLTAVSGQMGAAAMIHPNALRKFTMREARAIQGFPIDYDLRGGYTKGIERLGRSVPPLMMKAVAATVRDEILRKVSA